MRSLARRPRVAPATIALTLLTLAAPASAATLYAIGGNAGPSGGLTGLYTVDAGTAVMTWVGSPNLAGDYDNTLYNGGLAYDPYTDRLYGLGCDAAAKSALFLIDRTNASMIRIGDCFPPNTGAFCSGGLAFDITTQRLFAVGDLGQPPYQRTSLVELDTATGAATVIGDNGSAGTYLAGLGCDPRTGVLYGNGFRNFDQTYSGLFVLDKGTGLGTWVGGHGLTEGRKMHYSGLAVSPTSGVMYGMGSFSASQNNLYTVNQATGVATSVAPANPNGIGVDGGLVYVGTDILDASPASPHGFVPLHASPNPARGAVSFAFGLERPARVSLAVFDVAGRRVSTRVEGLSAGVHRIPWDGGFPSGERAASGLYFAVLRADGVVIGRTSVMLVR
jgi:hypothetical protein